MAGDMRSWVGKVGLLGRSHLATQLAVLLPVAVIVGLTAWTMVSVPTSARSQSSRTLASETSAKPVAVALQETAPLDAARPAPTEAVAAPSPEAAPSNRQAAPIAPPAINRLKISSQSWRRGGLGSNALLTFTLRNDNDYAVKDIEIACAFSRQDGSHLTDRKTFSRLHIGFVNINANKAKCAPVAANRI